MDLVIVRGHTPHLQCQARPVPHRLTILKAIVVARWLAWAWMFSIVAFISADDLRHPVAVLLPSVPRWRWPACPPCSSGPDGAPIARASLVAAEVGLALGLSIVDGYVFEPGHVFATSQSIATQWPLLAMATAGVAFGPIVAGSLGLLVGPAEWLGAEFNDFPAFGTEHIVSFVATSLFFAACGIVFGLNARLLKRAETEIADRRAL